MNIEYTGKYDAVAAKRFAGKVFDRIVRGTSIFRYVLYVACAVCEVALLAGGCGFNIYLPVLVVIIILSQKLQKVSYQKAIDGVSRRFWGNSTESTLVMTDDYYECRCGANLMRVAWRNLGSHYLFVGDGVAVMEGKKLPTLLVPCLAEKGLQADELKDALVRAGLKDYCEVRNYSWLVLLLAVVVGGAAAFFDLARSRPQIPQSASCIDEEDEDDDEDEWGDDFRSSRQKSFSLGDIDFDSKWIYLNYSLSDIRSSTNKQQISYQDFANIVAVLREQMSPKDVSIDLSIDDVASPARPLDILATLTNSHLAVELVLQDCTNLTDVAMLARVPLKELALIRCPIREIRGLESCPIESLTVLDCPLSSLADIGPLPRLKKLTLELKDLKVPSKEELRSHWEKLDIFRYHESESEDSEWGIVPLFSETERFLSAIAGADRVVIRDGGFGCCTVPERDPVLLVLTDPQEIADFRALFKFEDKGANGSCMCCGHPGIDWWKGDALVARTAVQHLQGVRWKGFYGDASLVPESRKSLGEWFAARNVKILNAEP